MTEVMPMDAPAPGLLTTTTPSGKDECDFSATIRATRSVSPPTVKGFTTVIEPFGALFASFVAVCDTASAGNKAMIAAANTFFMSPPISQTHTPATNRRQDAAGNTAIYVVLRHEGRIAARSY